MSIASEINNLKTYLTNAYAKCQAKSATIPANKNMANLAECIESIKQSPVAFNGADTIFGCGEVDGTGTLTAIDLTKLDLTKNLVLGGFNIIGAEALKEKFLSFTGEKVEFPTVKEIKNNGMYRCFSGAQGLTGGVSFPELTTIGYCGLVCAFIGCYGLTGGVSFPALTTIGSRGLVGAFQACYGLTGGVSFPALTTIGDSGLNGAFQGCNGLTELHFRVDMQTAVEAQIGYDNKFGATNATIYFDL